MLHGPPITWSLRRRLALFASAGLALAGFAIAFQLLIGDLANDRAFNPYREGGSPLRLLVAVLATSLPAGALVAGALLPLYRHRNGGVAVGLLTFAAGVAAAVATASAPAFRTDLTGDRGVLARAIILVCLAIAAAVIGNSAREVVLGVSSEADIEPNRAT